MSTQTEIGYMVACKSEYGEPMYWSVKESALEWGAFAWCEPGWPGDYVVPTQGEAEEIISRNKLKGATVYRVDEK